MFDDLLKPSVRYLLVKHDDWCPGVEGRADLCICNAVAEEVTLERMNAAIVETRTRAQRRAAAKKKGGAK